jgi:hypothetical protein
MTDTIPVIREADAYDQAWEMGYNRFEGIDVDSVEDFDVGYFRDSAAYANHTLPSLRALSGFADGGHGTFTIARDVVIIPMGCEDDSPAEGERTTSEAVFEGLVEEWHNGVYSAVENAAEDGSDSA